MLRDLRAGLAGVHQLVDADDDASARVHGFGVSIRDQHRALQSGLCQWRLRQRAVRRSVVQRTSPVDLRECDELEGLHLAGRLHCGYLRLRLGGGQLQWRLLERSVHRQPVRGQSVQPASRFVMRRQRAENLLVTGHL